MDSLQFLFDLTTGGNTSGYITPLLFERIPTGLFLRYIVRAIGQGFTVNLSSAPQTITFTVVQGVKVTSGPNFTFGFINALVDSNGVPTQSSQGVIDFDNPGDPGQGAGGKNTTNAWAVTINTFNPPTVPLGAIFGFYGKGVYSLFVPYRTYSAQVSGTVQEPGE